jgi:DNA excision repair protein ERCC-4
MKADPQAFSLPALHSLGDLAGMQPTLVIDTREQLPLTFGRLQSVPGTLLTGDYSVRGLEELFAVERKSIADIVGCCMGESRERFARELHRLRGFRFKRLLVIGTEAQILDGQFHSKIKPKAILATLSAFEIRFDVPVLFCETPEVAAWQIERWAFYFAREMVETVNSLWRGQKNTFAGVASK